MSFASGQIFGRLSKSCLKAFYSVLERSSTELDPGTVAALSMYVEIAQHAPARTINLGQRPCVFVYTDASREPTERGNVAGLGGVLCGPTGEPLRFFSVFPSAQELSRIGIDLSSRCIFLLELAAVCLAFKLWGDAFRGARVVCYCDNDGAKACLMGASSNKAANDLLKLQAARIEDRDRAMDFGVSKSNIADEPSREQMEELPGFSSAERSTEASSC